MTASGSEAIPSSDVVDEARSAAAGTRVAAKWLASALGSIPSLAVLASIVRSPGDAGFDKTKLWLGVGLAAAGAVLGVLAFARVIAPVPLEDKDLQDLDLRRIPGQPYEKFEKLRENLDALRGAEVDNSLKVVRALQSTKAVETAANRLEAEAKEADAAAKASPNDDTLTERAARARRDADAARKAADAQAAAAESRAAGHSVWSEQLARAEAVRRDAYGLKAADEVGKRFLEARIASVISVGLIAAGIVQLGLAPKPKIQTPASSVRLVTLIPNAAGRQALSCPKPTALRALKTGGTTSVLTVITLPTSVCRSTSLTFRTTPPKPLGTVTEMKPLISGG